MSVRRITPALGALLLGLALAGPGPAAAEAASTRAERGPVTVELRLDPVAVPIGDTVTLSLEVTAQAGVELLMPAFGTSLDRFTILEFVPRERIDEQGRTVASQRYVLQILASGEHAIPPITIEFVDRRPGQRPAPEDEDAYELLTEQIPFRVESVVPASAGGDLKPPLGPLEALADESPPGRPKLLGGLLAGAGAITLALLFLLRRRLRRRTDQRSAYQRALQRLDALESRPRPQAAAMDEFFVELTDLVRHYLEDRFALHAPELTTEEFLDAAASSPDLTRDHRRFLQDFLVSADRVKFARHVPEAADVEQALAAVRSFLQQTSVAEPDADSPQATLAREPARA